MRIKKLEIFGFKSFADRVMIHFDEGVTGIVGPNGCGKSNVVDALRWVMGEQNAKHLRGDQMQDIIFGGSQNRGPMGLAEVTLTLENDGQLIPQDYAHFDEIEVTRRLYRNGDSEYEINKRACRLRDITEFFLGTGVGTKAYSIIEQGRVSSLVQAKPEDRRQIIEEAAGITKYKMRKLAAERKMESTQQNLLRIQDITTEVEKRLSSLEKQAQKAKQHKELITEIKHLELHEATNRFFEFSNLQNFLSAQKANTANLLETHTQEISSHEAGITSQKQTLESKEEALSITQGLINTVENTIALANQDIQFTQTTLASKQKHARHISDETGRLTGRLAELNRESESLATQRTDLESGNTNAQSILQAASDKMTAATAKRAELYREQNQIQSKIMQASREASSAQAEITSKTNAREQARQREQALQQEASVLESQRSTGDTQKQTLQADIEAANTSKHHFASQIADLQTQLKTCAAELDLKNKAQREFANQIASKQGRLSALLESLKDPKQPEHAKYSRAGEHVDIPQTFENLVEDACAQRLDAYVLPDLDTGFELSKQGRIRFVANKQPFKFEIVSSRADALKKWDNARANDTVLITEDGELFDLDHSCVAGERQKGAGILAKKREIASLETELADLATQAESLVTEIADLTTKQASMREQLDQLSREHQAVSLNLARLEEALKAKDAADKNLQNRLSSIQAEQERLRNNPAYSDEQFKSLEEKWALALDIHQKLELDLKAHQEAMAQFETEYQAQSEAFTKTRIDAAGSKERLDHISRSQAQIEQNLKDIRAQIANLELQSKDLAEDEIALAAQEKVAVQKIIQAEKELLQLKVNRQNEYQSVQDQKELIANLEAAISQQRKKIETLHQENSKLQLEIRETELALETLHERLFEKYRVRPAEILTDFHHLAFDADHVSESIRTLSHQLERLGPINQGAIEEFEELQKRYAFLSSQSGDLANALGQLEAAIQKINETTKQRFEEAFNAINDKFSQVFPRLFRGGKAWLELTNPEDMLGTGVEIFAQPPGKKLGSIALMSGGEKALTATSLIFSIFLIKPSPFCLLDEVDAPLDEANVDRFSQMVAEMSKISQFIVITHNKRTMEKADQLYGVTMEQAGISKTVNVKVKENTAVGPGSQEAFLQ